MGVRKDFIEAVEYSREHKFRAAAMVLGFTAFTAIGMLAEEKWGPDRSPAEPMPAQEVTVAQPVNP